VIRAGSRALSIFTNVLSVRILHAHAAGSLRPGELEEALGWASQSSLRAAVHKLCDRGALVRIESEKGPPLTELTAAGRELLPVADALAHWLQGAPDGPIPLDDVAAHGVLRTLTAAWDATVVAALAVQPYTLIELSISIADLNYPALKRRFNKLRSTHLIAPVRTENTGAYAASEWLRRAAAPLAVASYWERRFDADAAPVSRVEVEALFLLALSLIKLPARSVGACALVVLTPEEEVKSKRLASVAVEVKRGTIVSAASDLGTRPTWALGSTDAWLEAIVAGRHNALRISGEKPHLAHAIVKALHIGLFRS
jgi:DNA-binding HxlR family transcriptional regulator